MRHTHTVSANGWRTTVYSGPITEEDERAWRESFPPPFERGYLAVWVYTEPRRGLDGILRRPTLSQRLGPVDTIDEALAIIDECERPTWAVNGELMMIAPPIQDRYPGGEWVLCEWEASDEEPDRFADTSRYAWSLDGGPGHYLEQDEMNGYMLERKKSFEPEK